ncbi:MAG: sulfite exporter TauE/SafE family protein [Candidatus Lokiarchaeota archaeon]
MLQFFIDPLVIIFLPSFLLGILHTALPCEDKSIFFFWSFGISKNIKRSLFILVLYGLGLMSANMLIALISVLISSIPILFGFIPNAPAINFFGAMSSSIAAIVIFILILVTDYNPHSRFKEENFPLNLNWERNRTSYLFGILVGFAPCIFEVIIYSQCLQYSLSSGIIEGLLIVFYFSLGTFIGLFPLALVKQGTSKFVKQDKNPRRNKIMIAMLSIIVIFNVFVMIFSYFGINIFRL